MFPLSGPSAISATKPPGGAGTRATSLESHLCLADEAKKWTWRNCEEIPGNTDITGKLLGNDHFFEHWMD